MSFISTFITHIRSFKLLWSSNFSTLQQAVPLQPLPHHAPMPLTITGVPPATIHIPSNIQCPNVACTIDLPHDYHYGIRPTPGPDSLVLHIKRFPVTTNPFPGKNVWTLDGRPPTKLQGGGKFFLLDYGNIGLDFDTDTHYQFHGQYTAYDPITLMKKAVLIVPKEFMVEFDEEEDGTYLFCW